MKASPRSGLLLAGICAALAGCNQNHGGSETETLTGRVFSPAGKPEAGAAVKVIPTGYDPARPDPSRILHAVTDAQGAFRVATVEDGPFNLIAAGTGNAWAIAQEIRQGASGISLGLAPPRAFRILFFDSSGARDSGEAFFPGTDIWARGGADTARLDTVPSGLARIVVQGRTGWRHDSLLQVTADTVRLEADPAGIVQVGGDAGKDCIPQPGENGFQYPLNALLAPGPGVPPGAEEPMGRGWTRLFDGQSRASFAAQFADYAAGNDTNTQVDSGWGYSAADSAIRAGLGSLSDIRSRQTYGDFDLRFSYRNSSASGIFYKTLTRDAFIWQSGVEFSLDDAASGASKQASGALFDLLAPLPAASGAYRDFAGGGWNFARIVVKGDSVEHWLNNVKVTGYRFWNARWNAALSASKWVGMQEFAQETPGCKCMIRKGYVGVQGSDRAGELLIRNLRITGDTSAVKLGPVGCPAL